MSDSRSTMPAPPDHPSRRRAIHPGRARAWRWLRRACAVVVLVPLAVFGVNYWRALYGDARDWSVADAWAFANLDSLAAAHVVASDSGPTPVAPLLESIAREWVELVNADNQLPGLIVWAQPRPSGDLVVALNPMFYRVVSGPEELADMTGLLGDWWAGTLATAAAPWPDAAAGQGRYEPGVVVVRLDDTPAGPRLRLVAESRDGVTRTYPTDTRGVGTGAGTTSLHEDAAGAHPSPLPVATTSAALQP